MRALDRKLVRDFLQMKGQSAAIALVIACGAATFVMCLSALESLKQTQARYYERYRFADVFAQLKRAPNALRPRIAEIPGVAQVQTRVVVSVNLDVPGLAEPASGRLVSIPEHRSPQLNDLYLRSGRYIEPGGKREVLASEGFCLAHGLSPGDQIWAVINGKKERLTIVGIALSPEYIYQIRPGDIFPDDKRFGIFWMGYIELSAAFDMREAFNDISLSLMPGASESDVLERLDRLTAPYGGLGAYGRRDQLSNQFITSEIEQLRAQAVIAPSIFLGVAAFLLNVVISRLINTQREQIAALKAFGYTNLQVGVHYLKFVLVLVIGGVTLGSLAGTWFGRYITEMYARFYRFPLLEFHLETWMILLTLAICGGAGVLGTLGAIRSAIRLPPAEAMRPEPPANYRPTIIERMGLQRLFSQSARMILRNLERRPVRAVLSSFGIALAVSILVMGSFTEDALDYMMEFQFNMSQRQDITISFVEPAPAQAYYDMRHLPGVRRCEAFRAVAVRLRYGHHSRRVGIMGLEPDATLNRLIDEHHAVIPLPPEGLVLSKKLGELLNARIGDTVTVEVLEGSRPVREVMVANLVADYSGLNAYMDIRAVNRLMWEGPTVSGAFLSVDSNRIDELHKMLKNTPRVATVTVKKAAVQSFLETVAENLLIMRAFNISFATIIAFGVVYNNARISLSERSRELATLRVIGFARGEISAILLGELGVLTLAAIPLGLVLGYGAAALATAALDTDLYRIPLIINHSTYAFATTVIFLAALVSGLIVRRRLDHLDLVAVLKSKE